MLDDLNRDVASSGGGWFKLNLIEHGTLKGIVVDVETREKTFEGSVVLSRKTGKPARSVCSRSSPTSATRGRRRQGDPQVQRQRGRLLRHPRRPQGGQGDRRDRRHARHQGRQGPGDHDVAGRLQGSVDEGSRRAGLVPAAAAARVHARRRAGRPVLTVANDVEAGGLPPSCLDHHASTLQPLRRTGRHGDAQGMQDVVRCSNCDRHCYNAPRTELGLKPVTLASRPDIKPSRRFRILDAHGHACVSCHRTDVDLQIDHLISREAADRLGFLDELIDSDLNLAPCAPSATAASECPGRPPSASCTAALWWRAADDPDLRRHHSQQSGENQSGRCPDSVDARGDTHGYSRGP